MRLIVFVADSGSIMRIRVYLGEPPRHRTSPAARGPPCEEDFDTLEAIRIALREPARV